MNSKGFSLPEVLIMMVIASIVGVLLISVWVQNNSLFYKENSIISHGVNINDVLSNIRGSVRSAAFVASNYDTGTMTFTSNSNTLVLALPSYDAEDKIIENTYDYLIIYQDSQNNSILKKAIYPNVASIRNSEDTILTTKLSSIIFRYFDTSNNVTSANTASKINFEIRLKDGVGSRIHESSSSGEFSLRND